MEQIKTTKSQPMKIKQDAHMTFYVICSYSINWWWVFHLTYFNNKLLQTKLYLQDFVWNLILDTEIHITYNILEYITNEYSPDLSVVAPCVSMAMFSLWNLDLLGCCALFVALFMVIPYGLGAAAGEGVDLMLPPIKCTWWPFSRCAGGSWFLDHAEGGSLALEGDWPFWLPEVNLGWGNGAPPQFGPPPQFMGPELIARGGTPQLFVWGWTPSKTGGAGILGDCWNCGFMGPKGE